MPDEEKTTNLNVQASDNSTAVGKVQVENVGRDVVIGGTHIHNYAPSEPVESPLAKEKLHTEYLEPETILIPEGPFWMGSDPGEGIPNHETPRHEVILPAYRIGNCPITNEQFAIFIQETGGLVTPAMGWEGQRIPDGLENHPVTGVTWYEALEYCRWLSGKTGRKYSLPNEAQWEKACRGGDNGIYPWGNEFDPARCNHGNSRIVAVDVHPAQNVYGLFDLVGNVRQWTITLWGEKFPAPDPKYAYPWKNDRRNDLKASSQVRRVVRGGSMKDKSNQLRCSARMGEFPVPSGRLDPGISFRVVISS